MSVSSDSISFIRQYQCHQTISVSSDSNSIIRYLEIHFYFGVECVCVWKQYSSWLQISMTSDLITSCVLRYILLPKLRHILRIQVYKECPKFHRNYKMGSLWKHIIENQKIKGKFFSINYRYVRGSLCQVIYLLWG